MEVFLGQIIALATFFAFPVIQYIILKKYSAREGRPQLWYLPAYGFRLVIRNLPGNKTLSDIKYRVRVREVVPACDGSSVATLCDTDLIEVSDTFLFPGTDQILVSFQLKKSDNGKLLVIHTDKLGEKVEKRVFEDDTKLVVDYEANLENWFNFDVRIAKRVEVDGKSLRDIMDAIDKNDVERQFDIPRVRNVG
jgi:hypothetical protein